MIVQQSLMAGSICCFCGGESVAEGCAGQVVEGVLVNLGNSSVRRLPMRDRVPYLCDSGSEIASHKKLVAL